MARPLLNSKFFYPPCRFLFGHSVQWPCKVHSSLVLLFVVVEDTKTESVLGE